MMPRLKDIALLWLLTLTLALPGLSSITVIDRDEARYAQASVQMIETGDYVNIRFQDRARNKKPAGSYWAQALSVKAFSNVESRAIWAHRLPSVLAAMIAVLATYWAGLRLAGREAALIGAGLLAISALLVFEAHIAKTDALLCAASACALAGLAGLRDGGGRRAAVVFWAALGFGVLIKGPLLPMVIGFTLLGLLIWERKDSKAWMRPLGFWLGPAVFAAIALPWFILIYRESGGAFFQEAIGGDLAPKIAGGAEKHWGPPGYYLGTIWLTFWPSCLLLIPGGVYAVKILRNAPNKSDDKSAGITAQSARTIRLLLMWIVPFWIMLEAVPTKLPHYTLPLFPAMALICGAAADAIFRADALPNALRKSRRIGAALFALISLIVLIGLVFGAREYAPSLSLVQIFATVMGCVLALMIAALVWRGAQDYRALGLMVILSVVTFVPLFGQVLPSLERLSVAKTLRAAMPELSQDGGARLYSPHFSEPSLAYYFGTQTTLGNTKGVRAGDYVIVDLNRPDDPVNLNDLCSDQRGEISGVNYSKGDEVALQILQLKTCS